MSDDRNPTTVIITEIASSFTLRLRERGEAEAADEIENLRHRIADMKAERARLLGALRDLKAEVDCLIIMEEGSDE